ncbi:MAG TPA: glutamate-5-semialdehyde dehydrogenase [Candidatus Omnitrophota bacterium]|nr:glutamate-5-semialdehyde dehydrogenase [Candidatus Omnitrophota bacterium]
MNKNTSVTKMAQAAKFASRQLAMVATAEKNRALRLMAKMLLAEKDFLVRENQKDIQAGEKAGLSRAMIDRLLLNDKRIQSMADCLLDTAGLADPVDEVIEKFTRPNGLVISKVRTPIGVIGIIFESRPNVTSDCVGLCLKSGNACILKGGKEAAYSNKAIFSLLRKALAETRISEDSIQLIESADRASVEELLKLNAYVDLIVPRGGEGLIRFVAEHSTIPVVKHYKGVCHTYVSEYADLNKAHKICFNAKVQRPGVCNAMETMLVHRDVAVRFLPGMIRDLKEAGVEIRGCPLTRKIVKAGVKAAKESDWPEEYLDLILAVKVVDSLQDAIDHINKYGSGHSDAIVTDSRKEAAQFFKAVDSACVYANASTRFTDGYEFGFGAEIGISTDKLHARGPMGLRELTTYKFVIQGKGQVRQ